MASAAILREWLFKTKAYHDKKKDGKDVEFNMKLESLSRVFDVSAETVYGLNLLTKAAIACVFDYLEWIYAGYTVIR
mgnify:CR=1 FL=1